MCLIVLSYQQHPEFDLVFAANRDEFYERPTRPAGFWTDENEPGVLAGKDLQAGGTWMGVTKEGKFAALTNYRNPDIVKNNPPSRGHLVLEFLKNSDRSKTYLQKIDRHADRYMGFSLIAGTRNQLGYYSNQQEQVKMLASGLYGLSNHLLNTPWPKVKRSRERLREILNSGSIKEEDLFNLLTDDRQAPAHQLPDTGIPRDLEKQVSPIFIKSDSYGTRCSTVLLIDKTGRVTFTERRYKPGSKEIEDENRFTFTVD